MAAKKKSNNLSSVVARSNDGTVQVAFTIPKEKIAVVRNEVGNEMAKDANISGFRKGKAPVEKVLAQADEGKIIEQIVWKLIPDMLQAIVEEHKLKPAVYPKIQLNKTESDKDWEIAAVTAELPQFTLGDYKKTVKGAVKSDSIWTPGKDDTKENEPTKEEKEHAVLQSLLTSTEINIPQILIEDEVNARLSQLLERLEKLGLNLDSYLASVGKDPQGLRQEYEQQAREAIKLQLILNRIAEDEKIEVTDREIEDTIKASGDTRIENDEQKEYIRGVLKRRKVLDSLTSNA